MAEGHQFFDREEAAVGQGRVEHGAGVPLGEEKAVAVRPIRPGRIDAQVMKIEGGHDLGRRKGAADVPGLRVVDHLEHVDAERLRLGREIPNQGFGVIVHHESSLVGWFVRRMRAS